MRLERGAPGLELRDDRGDGRADAVEHAGEVGRFEREGLRPAVDPCELEARRPLLTPAEHGLTHVERVGLRSEREPVARVRFAGEDQLEASAVHLELVRRHVAVPNEALRRAQGPGEDADPEHRDVVQVPGQAIGELGGESRPGVDVVRVVEADLRTGRGEDRLCRIRLVELGP